MILGGHFDLDSKKTKISELENKLSDPDIWNRPEEANKYNQEYVDDILDEIIGME